MKTIFELSKANNRSIDLFKVFSLMVISILIGLLILVVYVLVTYSSIAMGRYGLELFSTIWDPYREIYGLLIPLTGSLIIMLLSTMFSIILSIPFMIILEEYLSGLLKRFLEIFIEINAGLPTVIYAFIGLVFLSSIIREHVQRPLYQHLSFIPLFSCEPVLGTNMFTAALVLSIATIPFTTTLIREAYRMIPRMYIEAGYSLGLFKEEVVLMKLNMIKPAIVSAILVSASRILTETTIVALVAGSQFNLSACLFTPIITVPAHIVNNFGYSMIYPFIDNSLYFAALLLFIISLTLNVFGLTLYSRWAKRVL